MFGFFSSQNKKMRETARNWIEMAGKVWNYRRDLLSEADARELRARTEDLRKKVAAKADAAELKLCIESLEPVLQRLGGKIYPKTSMIDNVEFFLVVAIVILGIRAYIVQPFKIPTNSMWPSYYGMTADNLLAHRETPGILARSFRFLAFGAFRYEVLAPQAGEVTAKFHLNGTMACTVVNGRKWLLLPAQFKEYAFNVGGEDAKVRVPVDFNEFDDVVRETFFGSADAFMKAFNTAIQERSMEASMIQAREGSSEAYRVGVFKLGRTLNAGEPVVRFDILTGDQLFVDRVSYHFVRPSVGDGFVFRTGNIEGIGTDQYYIKRLVGLPGDKIEIKEPVLYRNGAPITGSAAFGKNARKEERYRGYFDASRYGWSYLRKDEPLTVPSHFFFALGDNSGNSMDGRYWGFVPAKDAIGRPLMIYYPFTHRWGLPK
ncbi:MAG: signal peptidase I [Opitutaceae bacterium]|jgi:signal peptidase I